MYKQALGWMGVALALGFQGCGSELEVQCVRPQRGEIHETFSEPAKTRIEKTYLITMPVSGRINRIDFEPGDSVTRGQPLLVYDVEPFLQEVEEAKALVSELEAEIAVKDYHELENTAKIETEAIVNSTIEAIKAAEAQVNAEKVRSERHAKELERLQVLAKEKSVTQSQLDDAWLDAETSLIELRKQEFNFAAMKAILVAVQTGPRFVEDYLGMKQLQRIVLVHKLAQAKTQLARAEHNYRLTHVNSPIDGVVLERHDRGDRYLTAGERLLLLGNLDQLEVLSDILTQDALRIQPGSRVMLEPASGLDPIEGRVRRIEPAGFTKLSSLGIEQQRVNVIVEFAGPHEPLGVGYQVQARFYIGTKTDALQVPRSAVMQSIDRSYYVLVVENNVLVERPVSIGLRGDFELEITAGLSENDLVVLYPDATMREGRRVSFFQ